MFRIPASSYREFLRQDLARIERLAAENSGHYAYVEHRRFGQRFSDHFKLDKLTRTEDCLVAQKIYYEPDKDVVDSIIAKVIDWEQ